MFNMAQEEKELLKDLEWLDMETRECHREICKRYVEY